jgi:hypothetical protein
MSDAWHDHNSTVGLARIASLTPTGVALTLSETTPEVVSTLDVSFGLRTLELAPELAARPEASHPHGSKAPGVPQDFIVSPAANGPQPVREMPVLSVTPWPSCRHRAEWGTQVSSATLPVSEPQPVPVAARVWAAAYFSSSEGSLETASTKPPCPALSDDWRESELDLLEPGSPRETRLLDPRCQPQTGLPNEPSRPLGGLDASRRVIPELHVLAPRLRVPMPSPENVQNIA